MIKTETKTCGGKHITTIILSSAITSKTLPSFKLLGFSVNERMFGHGMLLLEGLTIDEVLPFFVKYKLKLRVYDLYYNLIHKHDPEVPNFHQKPMYCLTDGNHIYLLNKDLESLAQRTDDEEYKGRVRLQDAREAY